MAQETVILTHTIHHPTQGGDIRVLQEGSAGDTYVYIHLESDPAIPQYTSWGMPLWSTPEKTYTQEDIKEAGYKLLLTFICVAYIEAEN